MSPETPVAASGNPLPLRGTGALFFMSDPKKPAKRKRGTRSKFTPAIQEAICHDIRAGLTREDAAKRNGICRETLWEWSKANQTFADALEKAWIEFETDNLTVIREASINRYDHEGKLTRRGSWQAACWLLERRLADKYALKWEGELSGKGGKPLIPDSGPKVDTSHFNKEQLDTLITATEVMLKAIQLPAPPDSGPNGHSGTNGHT